MQGETATLDEAKSFLSPAKIIQEISEKSSENSLEGYRSQFVEELNLLRQTSRRTVKMHDDLSKTTKFYTLSNPDELFQSFKNYFEIKGGVIKLDPSNFEMRVKLVANEEPMEIECFISVQNEKFLVNLSRIVGNHWDFYDIYKELLHEISNV